MKVKMPWLKTRLRQLDRTPTGLAQHLGIAAPRVYEMIAGRRGVQPNEIAPMAQYLEWSIEQILEQLPEEARIVPATITYAPNKSGMSAVLGLIPMLGTTRSPYNKPGSPANCDMVLTGETVQHFQPLPALQGRDDIFCFYLHSSTMTPWRERGEMVLAEMKRPPRDLDHVVIYLVVDDEKPTPVLVRQLLRQNGSKLRIRQYNPVRESDLDMKVIASMYRVLTWDDVVR